jgi:hypothetical protein
VAGLGKRTRLVTVSVQRINNCASLAPFEHPSSAKLTDLFRRLADRQVASAAFAMLDLASCGDSESLLGGLMGFLFGHGGKELYSV